MICAQLALAVVSRLNPNISPAVKVTVQFVVFVDRRAFPVVNAGRLPLPPVIVFELVGTAVPVAIFQMS